MCPSVVSAASAVSDIVHPVASAGSCLFVVGRRRFAFACSGCRSDFEEYRLAGRSQQAYQEQVAVAWRLPGVGQKVEGHALGQVRGLDCCECLASLRSGFGGFRAFVGQSACQVGLMFAQAVVLDEIDIHRLAPRALFASQSLEP